MAVGSPARSILRTMTNRDSQTLKLPDGRVLGYAEYGDPAGRPLFWFHGYPVSRLETAGVDSLARRRLIRIIAMDRPGFGLSTFYPERRIADFPGDVQSLADHLRLQRFTVVGGSGGSPYALACARFLPPERLSGVGVVAGMGTFDTFNRKYVSTGRKVLAAMAHYWPWGLRVATGVVVGVLRWLVTTRTVSRWIDAWLASLKKKGAELKKADQTVDDEVTGLLAGAQASEDYGEKKLIKVLFSGFTQDASGLVKETQLIIQDWGFRLEDITYDPVKMWHGTRDSNAPIGWARSTAERMPHARLREFDDNHYGLGLRMEEILDNLLSANKEGTG